MHNLPPIAFREVWEHFIDGSAKRIRHQWKKLWLALFNAKKRKEMLGMGESDFQPRQLRQFCRQQAWFWQMKQQIRDRVGYGAVCLLVRC